MSRDNMVLNHLYSCKIIPIKLAQFPVRYFSRCCTEIHACILRLCKWFAYPVGW